MVNKLKKVSFLTDPNSDPNQMSAVTFKDNLINGAQSFIQSRYPWLTDRLSITVTEADAEEATALLVATLIFDSTNFKIEFPIVYSDGEFLDVPGFYIPASDMWVTFNDKYYSQIKESLSDNITMGNIMEMSTVPAHENYEFEKDLGSDLFIDSAGSKYSSLAVILSSVPSSSLASFIKTAINKCPTALNLLYPAYKLSNIKTKSYVAPILKKQASGTPSWRPNITFTALKQVLGAPERLYSEFGITKKAAVQQFNSDGYTTLSKKYVDIEMIDGKEFTTIDDNSEVVSSHKLYNKIEKTPEGKPVAFIDVMTGMYHVCINPKHNLFDSYDHGLCCGSNYSSGFNSYTTSSGNAQPSYNALFERVPNAEDVIHDDSPNFLVQFLSPKSRDKLIGRVFNDKLTFNYIIEVIKACLGDFRTGKMYSGPIAKIPFLHDNNIYSNCLPDEYPRKHTFTVIDLGNGYKKLQIFIPANLAEDNEDSCLTNKIAEYIFNADSGIVTKIKTVKGDVTLKTTEDKPFMVMAGDNYKNKSFLANLSSYDSSVKLTGGEDEYKIYFGISTHSLAGNMKNYNSIIHAAIADTNSLIVKRSTDDKDSKSEIYSLIYNAKPENGNSIALEKISKLDARITLSALGLSNSDINDILKQAAIKDNIMFAIKPNDGSLGMPSEGSEEKPKEKPDKRTDDLAAKEFDLLDKQLGMMFEFIKTKFTEIESGMANKEDILAKQLEVYENKISSVDELSAKLDAMSANLESMFQTMSQPAAQPAQDPSMQAGVVAPQQPTLDPQTAQLITQSIADPNMAAHNGFDPQTLQLVQAAMQGDPNAAQQLGMSQSDIMMLNDTMSSSQAGAAQPGAIPAPMAGPVPPMQAPGMTQAVPAPAPAQAVAPQDAVATAENLVAAMFDPAIAQQMGVTEQDKQYIMGVVNDPSAAINQGEDPAMVSAVVDAYNRTAGMGNMQNSMSVAAQPGQAAPMPMTESAQPAVSAMQGASMPQEASVMESSAMLLDMLPRIKSSKLFYKYTNDFKKMLSILGELLFSLQYQSAKYKKALGNEAFENTIGTLRKLYEDFGDFVLKMYTIDNK